MIKMYLFGHGQFPITAGRQGGLCNEAHFNCPCSQTDNKEYFVICIGGDVSVSTKYIFSNISK